MTPEDCDDRRDTKGARMKWGHLKVDSRSPGPPEVDHEVDALLAERFTPADHRLWWRAEHVLLGGQARHGDA